jgi:hypothetical protein
MTKIADTAVVDSMGSERSASLYLDNESDAGSDASGPTTLSTASASAAPPKTGRGPGRRESRNDP